MPGGSRMNNKRELAKASHLFPFVPTSFVLPEQYDDWRRYDIKLAEEGVQTRWVRKSIRHRGVQVTSPKQLEAASLGEQVVVQQLVRPHLIDNKLWDLGVYVAITNLTPLRAYIYDNVLMRHCTRDYNPDLGNAHVDSYVVSDDYAPPWALPSLRPYFAWGLSTKNALRAYLHSQGLDFALLYVELQACVVELLRHFQPTMVQFASKYPHGSSNFFTLYRFDFMVDPQLQPWLVEVNQSPNLSSRHTQDLKEMFRKLSYDFLSLANLAPGGLFHPSTDAQFVQELASSGDVDIGFDVCHQCLASCQAHLSCLLCRRCRTVEQTAALQGLVVEHRCKGGFKRLIPLPAKLA